MMVVIPKSILKGSSFFLSFFLSLFIFYFLFFIKFFFFLPCVLSVNSISCSPLWLLHSCELRWKIKFINICDTIFELFQFFCFLSNESDSFYKFLKSYDTRLPLLHGGEQACVPFLSMFLVLLVKPMLSILIGHPS